MLMGRCFHVLAKTAIAAIAVTVALITIYHPDRHASHYPYIEDELVLKQLVPEKYNRLETNLKNCSYADLLLNSVEVDASDIHRKLEYHLPDTGGEYNPKECRALYKTAILIPYRNRKEQLDIFLNYIHHFLQNQKIHYKIFVAEQGNNKPFNRAMMFNYAAVEAIKQGFNCLILHDVDLIPVTTGNIYACTKKPRHMTCSVDTFRFNLPYLGLFGGVISIRTGQFKAVNGMSNVYEGWGGEDDDFYARLSKKNLVPQRFSPHLSKYIMLNHRKEKPSEARFDNLKTGIERQQFDGLNSLEADLSMENKPLYTHIIAR